MNFSDCIDHSSGVLEYSPNGNLVAIAKGFDINVFETTTLRPINRFVFNDVIEQLNWASDSTLILVGIPKRGMAFARNVFEPDWNCKIDEGLAGMLHCRWAPTGRLVLTVSECKLRLTVWSLTDKSIQYIPSPKHEDRGVDFSPDNKLMAVVQKPTPEMIEALGSQGDALCIYGIRSIGSWKCLHQLALDTAEVEDIKFSRDGRHLIVWETPGGCSIKVY